MAATNISLSPAPVPAHGFGRGHGPMSAALGVTGSIAERTPNIGQNLLELKQCIVQLEGRLCQLEVSTPLPIESPHSTFPLPKRSVQIGTLGARELHPCLPTTRAQIHAQTPPRIDSPPFNLLSSPQVLRKAHFHNHNELFYDSPTIHQIPMTYPTIGGPYAVVRGRHLIDIGAGADEQSAYGARLWATLSDPDIQSRHSPDRDFEIGVINKEQRVLVAAARRIPECNQSELQRSVVQWAKLRGINSNHPAANVDSILGVRLGSNGVLNPFDLQAHRLLQQVHKTNVDSGVPTLYVDRLMKLIRTRIFVIPGRYSELVAKIQPGLSKYNFNEPKTALYLNCSVIFNTSNFPSPDSITPLDAATYLWVGLNLSRQIGQDCLEPFCRRAARQEVAMATWDYLVAEEAIITPTAQMIFGAIPKETARANFCGPEGCPYNIEYVPPYEENVHVCYRPPTQTEVLTLRHVDPHSEWIPEFARDAFLTRYHSECCLLSVEPVSD